MINKEYRLEVKIKNNLILSKIENLGYSNINKFCIKNNISSPTLSRLLGMKISPIHGKGEYRKIVHKLCDIFNCIPEELFTTKQIETVILSNKRSILISEAEIKFQLENNFDEKLLEDHFNDSERDKCLAGTLEEILTPKECKVIKARFGFNGTPATFGELANEFGVTKERIRQIEATALRRLKKTNLMDKLKEY